MQYICSTAAEALERGMNFAMTDTEPRMSQLKTDEAFKISLNPSIAGNVSRLICRWCTCVLRHQNHNGRTGLISPECLK